MWLIPAVANIQLTLRVREIFYNIDTKLGLGIFKQVFRLFLPRILFRGRFQKLPAENKDDHYLYQIRTFHLWPLGVLLSFDDEVDFLLVTWW